MQKLFATLLDEASGHGRRLATFIVVMICATLCGVIGAGFLTAGAYLWLAPRYGAMEAALGIGAFFIVVAVIIAVAASTRQRPPATPAAPPKTEAPPIPPAVSSLLQALQENGRDNERLALLATTEAIKNASPLQLVVTGLVAGYVGGQMLKQVLTKPKSK